VTFHEEDKLRTVLWQWSSQEFSQDELQRLRNLREALSQDEELFTSLITIGEFKALLARIDRLIVEGAFPEPSDQWPAVPWPPF
jgi:hypothetical protein